LASQTSAARGRDRASTMAIDAGLSFFGPGDCVGRHRSRRPCAHRRRARQDVRGWDACARRPDVAHQPEHARARAARPARLMGRLCRRNVIASARTCTPVLPDGLEGVDVTGVRARDAAQRRCADGLTPTSWSALGTLERCSRQTKIRPAERGPRVRRRAPRAQSRIRERDHPARLSGRVANRRRDRREASGATLRRSSSSPTPGSRSRPRRSTG
jgi:hypothetical protein